MLIVPYSRHGKRPRAQVLGDLACCARCSGGPALGALSAPAQPAAWQTNPYALRKLVSQVRSSNLSGLGASAGGSAAEGGLTGAKAGGTVAGPIGAAVGAVVGAIAGYILGAKHYFNVGDSNSQCQQLIQAWQQYTSIQGHIAGRALGWPTMQQLFHAAVGAGLFPGNNMHLQFHEGTLLCAGHGDWVDDFLGINLQDQNVNNCGAHNCMADALVKYQQSRGALPPGTPDAVYFVDQILLPMNSNAQIPWVYQGAQNPQVHQLFYDTADAYLAQNASGTTPYVQFPQAQTGTPTPGAVSAAPAPAPAVQSVPAIAAPAVSPVVTPASVPASIPVTTSSGAAGSISSSDLNSLVAGMVAQGQTQNQAVNSAVAALQSQGVQNNQALTSALQQMAANQAAAAASAPTVPYTAAPPAAAAPAGTTGALTVGGTLANMTPTDLIGLAVGVTAVLLWLSRRNESSESSSRSRR